MKVRDIRDSKIIHKLYGYCMCGREVTKGVNEVCPLCGAVLEWEKDENEKNDKN